MGDWLMGDSYPKYSLTSVDGSGPYTIPGGWYPAPAEMDREVGSGLWLACYWTIANGTGPITTGALTLKRSLNNGPWTTVLTRPNLQPWFWFFDPIDLIWILSEGDVLVYNVTNLPPGESRFQWTVTWGDPPENPISDYLSQIVTLNAEAVPITAGQVGAPVLVSVVETGSPGQSALSIVPHLVVTGTIPGGDVDAGLPASLAEGAVSGLIAASSLGPATGTAGIAAQAAGAALLASQVESGAASTSAEGPLSFASVEAP